MIRVKLIRIVKLPNNQGYRAEGLIDSQLYSVVFTAGLGKNGWHPIVKGIMNEDMPKYKKAVVQYMNENFFPYKGGEWDE